MLSKSRAYQIVLRCIKAVAGMAEPDPDFNQTLEEVGISTKHQLGLLRNGIITELSKAGLEFQKMSIDDIDLSSTIKEVAHLVSYARVKSERFY